MGFAPFRHVTPPSRRSVPFHNFHPCVPHPDHPAESDEGRVAVRSPHHVVRLRDRVGEVPWKQSPTRTQKAFTIHHQPGSHQREIWESSKKSSWIIG